MFSFSRIRSRSQLWILCASTLFLFFSCPLHAQAARTKPEERIASQKDRTSLKLALAAYDQGRPQGAEPALRDLVHRYPGNFAATETLGLILAERGDFLSALPLLQTACRLRPSSAIGFANLGALLLKMKRPQEAVKALKRSASLDPKNPETQSSLGQALMQLGRPAEAAAAFSAAAKGKPGDGNITYNWALALFNAKELKQAGEVLNRFPQKESSAEAQSLFADIEEEQGNYKAAAEHFKTAAELDPSEANLYALGVEFLRHWTFPAAIKVYEFGLTKYPSSDRLRVGLGVAEYGNSNYARAIPIFTELLAASPDNALYADLLGRSCLSLSEELSCDSLQTFALKHPQNATAATFAAANILRRPENERDTQLARRLLEQAISADSKVPEAYFQMGVLDEQEMKWQESVKALEKAVALRPEYSQAHYRLGRAYRRLGQNEKAEQELALSQEYGEQEKKTMDANLQEVTTFLVTLK